MLICVTTLKITRGTQCQIGQKQYPLKPYPIGQKLFTSQAGGFADHFHPFTSHCIFMCIVGSENMLLSKRSGGKILILQKTYSEINYEATWQSEWEEMAYFKCIGKG